jgi:hypothetical protein
MKPEDFLNDKEIEKRLYTGTLHNLDRVIPSIFVDEHGVIHRALWKKEVIQYGSYTGAMGPIGGYQEGEYVPLDQVDPSDINSFSPPDAVWKKAFEKVTTDFRKNITPLSDTFKSYILNNCWNPEDGSSLPLTFLDDGTVGLIPVVGTVLVQDQIPPIDKAVFAQAKHQFGDDFGVPAWYLRSVGDDTHSIAYANGDHNDVASFDQLANVIGLGATWRIGDNIRLSYDWGQNRTDFGRFMNGNTIYNHEMGTSDFDIAGRSNGGTPRFWVARVDIGEADTDQPGSWNAFADYKYFQHDSFFGGNGTEGVPDRYMDGIKSFTISGGYVPAKDFLLEAFYTFGAKGIGKRDTLYGPEHFTLGDYTRIQATFKF